MDKETWKNDITDYEILTQEKLDFILEESRQRLKGTVSSLDSLDAKGTFLIGYLATTVTVFLAYFLRIS